MTKNIGNDAEITKIRLKDSPFPESDPDPGYAWLIFQDGSLFIERDDGTLVGPFIDLSVIVPNQTGSTLVSGGQVVWESDLIFRVSAASYFINGVHYTSAEQTVELNAADETNPRIDVIALDNTGTVVKISGEPGATPSKPDIDPATQIELTFVLVPTSATEPGGIATTDLYLENAGTPTEWGATDSGATIDVASTNNPRTGSTCIELTAAANGNWFLLTATDPISLANQETLVLFIRSKAAWANQKSLRLSFRNAGVVQGAYVTVDDGLFGFSSTFTSDYQQVAIPLSQFNVPGSSTVDQLMVEVRGAGGNIGGYFDDIVLQGGTTIIVQQGISQAAADARYLRQSNNLSDLGDKPVARTNLNVALTSIDFLIDGGGQAITTGLKGFFEIPFACEIVSNRLLGDTSGNIVLDIWHSSYADLPAEVTDSITASAKPTLSGEQKSEDTTLVDWIKTINAGDWLYIYADSADTLALVVLSLVVRRL
jgi:hypothetical protein